MEHSLVPKQSTAVLRSTKGWYPEAARAPMSSMRARPHPSGQGEPDQFGEAARCHLVHYARTVDLYGTGTDRKVVSNRFVGQPGEQPLQHFPLARREERQLGCGCDRGWILFRVS